MKKPLPKTLPRRIDGAAWYYVNRHSIDLYIERARSNKETIIETQRLTRGMLQEMLAELK